jgi:putative Mg2+ transporter-C (MgtC) family protein
MWSSFVQQVMRDVHFDLPLFASLVGKVALAWVLTFPISVERARDDRSAGLRTFPVVAAASCSLVLLAGQVFGLSSGQQTNILQGLVTGIGFIGGGAILREGNRIRGTATAAAIWSTAIVGAAVGYGRVEIAVVLSAFTSLTLYYITRYEWRHGLRDPITGEAPLSSQPDSDTPSSLPRTPR